MIKEIDRHGANRSRDELTVIAVATGTAIACVLLCMTTILGMGQYLATAAARAEDEVHQEFIAANPKLDLDSYVERGAVTDGGLTSSLASSLCLIAAENAGIELHSQPVRTFGGSNEKVYAVYSTEANEAFYVQVWGAEEETYTCKATGSSTDPSVSLL